jgi:hypothetical protein
VTWFLLHFLLIVTISCRELLWLVGNGLTLLPSPAPLYSQKAEAITAAALGEQLPAANPIHQVLATYLHSAGIEVGYGYFAPNVPDACKLLFELHYPDGRTEYETPRVNSRAAELRLAGLLDTVGRTHSEALREHMIKMLVSPIWRAHPEVRTIRALFGTLVSPSIADFESGKRETYQFRYAYDFSLTSKPTAQTTPKREMP